MEAIEGWIWDQFEADFQHALAALRQFVAREGHPRVPVGHVEHHDGGDINLYNWVSRRLSEFRKARLSAERVAALETVEGWEWDRR